MQKLSGLLGCFLISLGVTSAFAQSDELTVVHCGQAVDVIEGELRTDVWFEVADGRITQVSSTPLSSDAMIDLSEHTCLPGLIDMHVHLTHQSSPDSYLQPYTLNPADFAFKAAAYAKRTLEAGFTTVRNLGDRGDGSITVSLRKAVAAGLIPGPRIYSAGKSIATTGGHADPTNGASMALKGDPGPKQGVVNSADDARKAVRQRYKDGADVIKITATGGVLSAAKNGENPQFTDEELAAIIDTAKDYGFKVAAHAHGAQGMKRAIRAGVHSIEHGTLMDDETRQLMKRYGTYLVPTILAGEFVAEKAKIDGYFPEVVRPKAATIGPQLKANFKKAFEAGVKIAFGTDSGVSAHGENAREFALMVEAGMSPMQAIQSATVHAADLLGQSDALGSLEVGKWADLVAVSQNPLEDVSVLEDIAFVMQGGRIVKAPTQ